MKGYLGEPSWKLTFFSRRFPRYLSRYLNYFQDGFPRHLASWRTVLKGVLKNKCLENFHKRLERFCSCDAVTRLGCDKTLPECYHHHHHHCLFIRLTHTYVTWNACWCHVMKHTVMTLEIHIYVKIHTDEHTLATSRCIHWHEIIALCVLHVFKHVMNSFSKHIIQMISYTLFYDNSSRNSVSSITYNSHDFM